MRYFLQAFETESGIPFEQEVNDEADYERLKQQLEKEGYEDFCFDERWSDLGEMYQQIEQDQNVSVDVASLDELASAQLPQVLEYCREQGISSITKSSPVWMGIDSAGNAVVIPPEGYKPRFPGS